jgi:hypothetical protein
MYPFVLVSLTRSRGRTSGSGLGNQKKTVDAIGLARMRDGGTAELEACEVAFFLWDKTLHVPHEGKKELHTFVVRAIQSAR